MGAEIKAQQLEQEPASSSSDSVGTWVADSLGLTGTLRELLVGEAQRNAGPAPSTEVAHLIDTNPHGAASRLQIDPQKPNSADAQKASLASVSEEQRRAAEWLRRPIGSQAQAHAELLALVRDQDPNTGELKTLTRAEVQRITAIAIAHPSIFSDYSFGLEISQAIFDSHQRDNKMLNWNAIRSQDMALFNEVRNLIRINDGEVAFGTLALRLRDRGRSAPGTFITEAGTSLTTKLAINETLKTIEGGSVEVPTDISALTQMVRSTTDLITLRSAADDILTLTAIAGRENELNRAFADLQVRKPERGVNPSRVAREFLERERSEGRDLYRKEVIREIEKSLERFEQEIGKRQLHERAAEIAQSLVVLEGLEVNPRISWGVNPIPGVAESSLEFGKDIAERTVPQSVQELGADLSKANATKVKHLGDQVYDKTTDALYVSGQMVGEYLPDAVDGKIRSLGSRAWHAVSTEISEPESFLSSMVFDAAARRLVITLSSLTEEQRKLVLAAVDNARRQAQLKTVSESVEALLSNPEKTQSIRSALNDDQFSIFQSVVDRK